MFGRSERSAPSLMRRLLIFAIINGPLLSCVFIFVFSTDWHYTTMREGGVCLIGKTQSWSTDSWYPMNEAFEHIDSGSPTPVYSDMLFHRHIKFQYPPISLFLFYPLSWAGMLQSARYITLLHGISWICMILLALYTLRIFNFSMHAHGLEDRQISRRKLLLRAMVIGAMTFSFYPAVKACTLGQIQTWLNVLMAAVVLLWMKDKKSTCGLLCGVACLIKPQYLLLLVWGLVRRDKQFSRAFAMIFVTGTAASLMLFGVQNIVDYIHALSFISLHGEGYFPNQSMNGLLNRLLLNGNNTSWSNDFPPYNAIVYFGTIISSALFITTALYIPAKKAQTQDVSDFLIIMLTTTIASPVAWEHHYGVLLPIYAYLLPVLLKHRPFGKLTMPWLAASYILSSNYFDIAKKTAGSALNISQSYLFFGALMALAALYMLLLSKKRPSDFAARCVSDRTCT